MREGPRGGVTMTPPVREHHKCHHGNAAFPHHHPNQLRFRRDYRHSRLRHNRFLKQWLGARFSSARTGMR